MGSTSIFKHKQFCLWKKACTGPFLETYPRLISTMTAVVAGASVVNMFLFNQRANWRAALWFLYNHFRQTAFHFGHVARSPLIPAPGRGVWRCSNGLENVCIDKSLPASPFLFADDSSSTRTPDAPNILLPQDKCCGLQISNFQFQSLWLYIYIYI